MKSGGKGCVIAVLVLLIGIMIIPEIGAHENSVKTWYVDDDGGADFTKIQDAINASEDGDTIFVYSGTYYENIFINKSIYLKGEDKDKTVIFGNSIKNVINVSGNYITISGFTITSNYSLLLVKDIDYNIIKSKIEFGVITYEDRNGIKLINSKRSIIKSNNIKNSYYSGIYLYNSSNNIIKENNITENYEGISISSSSNNTIDYNIIFDNYYSGICLGYSSDNNILNNNLENSIFDVIAIIKSSRNNIYFNKIKKSIYRNGILLLDSTYNNIKDNNFSKNSLNGIELSNSPSNVILNNEFYDNFYAISISSSDDNILQYNIIKNNNKGIKIEKSLSNTIKQNYFILNGIILNGDDIKYWNTHTIINNTVNGKKIYYLKNETNNFTIPLNAGQIILVNCQNIIIQNQNFEKIGDTIQISFSKNCIISKNNFTGNKDENNIYLYNSININITENKINNGYYGIYLYNSSKISIINNIVINILLDSIYMKKSQENTISENVISNRYGGYGNGIYLSGSNNNLLCGNSINKSHSGILLGSSLDNRIIYNYITNSDSGIEFWGDNRNNIISNNNISNNRGIGVYFRFNSTYNNIINNNISKNRFGVLIWDKNFYNHLINNKITENEYYGIYIYNSSGHNIINNRLLQNKYGGIYLSENTKITIINNKFFSEGISIIGSKIQNWNSHIIDNNTINKKIIYYYKNYNNKIIIPNEAGQVILANCQNIIIQNQNFEKIRTGIQIGFSKNCRIFNNTITTYEGYSDTYYSRGIYLYQSSDIEINTNKIVNNNYGITIEKSSKNHIFNNIISNNNYFGIILIQSSENHIYKNNIEKNGNGIYLSVHSYKNLFNKNNLIENEIDAKFFNCSFNFWINNYWDELLNSSIKIIYGIIYLKIFKKEINWINFDFIPAKEPYDFGGDW